MNKKWMKKQMTMFFEWIQTLHNFYAYVIVITRIGLQSGYMTLLRENSLVF